MYKQTCDVRASGCFAHKRVGFFFFHFDILLAVVVADPCTP